MNSNGALVVTGGASGIGASIVRRAAATGLPVALLYRTSGDAAAKLVEEVEAEGQHRLAGARRVAADEFGGCRRRGT